MLLDSENVDLRFVKNVIGHDCKEICCYGTGSERLHDDVDELVEQENRLSIVTTWFDASRIDEACWYFVHLAGNQPNKLIAMVDANASICSILERQMHGASDVDPTCCRPKT